MEWNGAMCLKKMTRISLHSTDMNGIMIPTVMAELTEEIRQQMNDDYHIRRTFAYEANMGQ